MRATLVLADGYTCAGASFGAPPPTVQDLAAAAADGSLASRLRDVGEVVFNTAMNGYTEVLTDPSYTGQVVVMTYPHIGNYGVDVSWAESDPEPGTADRRSVQVAGFVVRELYRGPVPSGRSTLDAYLGSHGIPGVEGVDSRGLTLHLRRNGSANGVICRGVGDAPLTSAEVSAMARLAASFPPMEGRGLLATVGAGTRRTLPGSGGPRLALYDCGTKSNIVRELQSLGCTIELFPATATAAEIAAGKPDAVLLSNGPGDPAVLEHQVAQARALIGELPLIGICLGHQIIAQAAGARTSKMKFGHHGVNHPVRDEIGRRVFVTSQNHGFTVEEETLPDGMSVWFRNANDGTVEGLRDDARRIRTTQFHPESAPGPTDSRWIFTEFLKVVD